MARLPPAFAAVLRALRETHARAPSYQPRSMLDFGSGPGTAIWAAQEVGPAACRPHPGSNGSPTCMCVCLLASGQQQRPIWLPNHAVPRALLCSCSLGYCSGCVWHIEGMPAAPMQPPWHIARPALRHALDPSQCACSGNWRASTVLCTGAGAGHEKCLHVAGSGQGRTTMSSGMGAAAQLHSDGGQLPVRSWAAAGQPGMHAPHTRLLCCGSPTPVFPFRSGANLCGAW
jgi:hypothetical protein